MADYEGHGSLELSVGGPAPLPAGKLAFSLSRRWQGRSREPLDKVLAAVGQNRLTDRLAESEEVEALLTRAIGLAADTALQAKRQLLGQLVTQAVLDDADVDEASVLIDILSRVDAPHIRCLEAISRAEKEAADAGELEVVPRGAEKPHQPRAQRAAEGYPTPVIRTLLNEGLIDCSIQWDGYLFMKGMTPVGEQLLADLRTVTPSESVAG